MNNLSQLPYKGLAPYEEQDKDNFWGSEDLRLLVDKIQAQKLTFLFAASGGWKSLLLPTGVIPA